MANMTCILVMTVSLAAMAQRPGDRQQLEEVHPMYDLVNLRPSNFEPNVSGLRWLSDDQMLMLDWNGDHGQVTQLQHTGRLYIVTNIESGTPDFQLFAEGLTDPLGLEVVNGRIYVCGGEQLVEILPDNNDDGMSDGQRVIFDFEHASHGRHEFVFGLLYEEPFFYLASSASKPGGSSTPNINENRGAFWRIHQESGEAEVMSAGLRTPNGVGYGPEGEIFQSDNQGVWLPSSKIMHIPKDEFRFFGHRQEIRGDGWTQEEIDVLEFWKSHEDSPPVVWLPQGQIGRSPTEPVYIDHGVFEGQMYVGDVAYGGIQRVFIEKVAGEFQGAVFRAVGGLEAGVNRLLWGPDNSLYVGGTGEGDQANWGWRGFMSGFQRLVPNNESAFEIKAVYSKPDGFTLEFTEPVGSNASEISTYFVETYTFVPDDTYGGGNEVDKHTLTVAEVQVSPDKMAVYLGILGLQTGYAVEIRASNLTSESGDELWNTEAFYTLNNFGTGDIFDLDNGLVDTRRVSAEPENFKIVKSHTGYNILMANSDRFEIELHNLQGKSVQKLTGSNKSEVYLATRELNNGIYYLTAENNLGSITKKLHVIQ